MNLDCLRHSMLTAVVVASLYGAFGSIPAQSQASAGPAGPPPSWAFPSGPGRGDPDPNSGPQHVPGSNASFTAVQIGDRWNVVDWHPGDHPPMPNIVERGRKPEARACAFCHLPNGQGRPENASLAGLPAAYIEQQIADWKSGLRGSSEPKMGAPLRMGQIAKAASTEETKIAAEYFSSLTFKPWIRVVESETVPNFRAAGSMLVLTGEPGAEPLGQRIVEVPEDLKRVALLDSRSGFVAYVPVGSIKKGEALVTTGGGGKTIRCAICHGPDLKGLGYVPPLAGRSPSTVVRQLYNMQSGARKGLWSELMKDVVSKLTIEDMVAIAAYTSSRTP